MISRLGFGYLIAVAVALVVHNLPQSRIAQPGIFGESKRRTGLNITGAAEGDFAATASAASPFRKLMLAVQSATADFLDVAFYFIIGVAITSVFSVGVNRDVLAPLAQCNWFAWA